MAASRTTSSSTPSSLTSIFSFPTECATATGQWLQLWEEIGHKCDILTDAYYSPAICPSGYTAAFTGPSMAPGETAMFCCPLGMSSIGGAACSTYCVSASLSSDSPFPSIYLQKVRDAIQIRWQSSDLSVLETHPLTLGLTLNPPAPTLPPLAQLEPAYKIAIGLAFLPF
ncbi:hypothetical protein BKA61DRAFT_2990 [Leptodontidium sp. MPI-SDFR-AT-0119]|nr:hypothetical protein BKA61DRAFT_2990 [Leptodontidium sp. MPI-SDFR-AT-0119]